MALVITLNPAQTGRDGQFLSVEVTVTGATGDFTGIFIGPVPPGMVIRNEHLAVWIDWPFPAIGTWKTAIEITDSHISPNVADLDLTFTIKPRPTSSIISEALGVKQMLGDPLDQAPSIRQIVLELEAEYQHLNNVISNRGQAQHIGELVITTVPDQTRYVLDVPSQDFFKALSMTSIPSSAIVTGGEHDLRMEVTSGDDHENMLEFYELEHGAFEWAYMSKNRGQVLSSSHDSQMVGFYKTIIDGEGEKLVLEMRPTPARAQRYRLLYQITDWWDRVFAAPSAGVDGIEFRLPHSSQRMMIRATVGMNLIQKGVVKWALNDQYNTTRGTVVLQGLTQRYERYKEAFNEYLDTLEHEDIVFIELFGDRL